MHHFLAYYQTEKYIYLRVNGSNQLFTELVTRPIKSRHYDVCGSVDLCVSPIVCLSQLWITPKRLEFRIFFIFSFSKDLKTAQLILKGKAILMTKIVVLNLVFFKTEDGRWKG